MTDYLLLVFTNPAAGQDDAFNEWYDSRHVVDLLAIPGVVSAQRYDSAPMTIPEDHGLPVQFPPPEHRYLAVYELDRDPDDVMKEFLDRIADGRTQLSETVDMASTSMATWTPRGRRVVAD